MTSPLELLLNRNSAAKLEAPAPSVDELKQIQQAAMRAPDHGRVRPWRFLTIQGEARNKMGALFVEAMLQDDPDTDQTALDKARNNPLRAPMIITVIANLQESDKAPDWEQMLSAGCAAHGILLACEALGYAGIWRTGPLAEHAHVTDGLGLKSNEKLIGFLYIGTRVGNAKPLPELHVSDFWQDWQ